MLHFPSNCIWSLVSIVFHSLVMMVMVKLMIMLLAYLWEWMVGVVVGGGWWWGCMVMMVTRNMDGDTLKIKEDNHDTVQCHYNTINFLPNPHKIHPIARPLGRDVERLLWFQPQVYVYTATVIAVIYAISCCIHGHVIMVFGCTMITC